MFSSAGTESVGGKQLSVLDVDAAGVRVRWFIDPKTGYILRSQASGTDMTGSPVTEVTNYSDFRKVEGLVQPFQAIVMQNGEQSAKVTLSEIDVNPAVPGNAFTMP